MFVTFSSFSYDVFYHVEDKLHYFNLIYFIVNLVESRIFLLCNRQLVCSFQHTDLSQYLEKHPGGLNTFNVKVRHYGFISSFLTICYILITFYKATLDPKMKKKKVILAVIFYCLKGVEISLGMFES